MFRTSIPASIMYCTNLCKYQCKYVYFIAKHIYKKYYINYNQLYQNWLAIIKPVACWCSALPRQPAPARGLKTSFAVLTPHSLLMICQHKHTYTPIPNTHSLHVLYPQESTHTRGSASGWSLGFVASPTGSRKSWPCSLTTGWRVLRRPFTPPP